MSGGLRIAIASGKGGTGKTTVATNLAVVLAESGVPVAYVDCDVEEPNGHIFLKPEIQSTREVSILVPEVDESRCTLCGACGNACRFSAIVALPSKVLTFPKLCHGCGGCMLGCTVGAIREAARVTGVVERGTAGKLTFLQGRLDIGEAMAPPVIRAVLDAAPTESTVVIDAPPGTSCPVIAAVKTADVVLLVTEPTPFGLNDLKLAVDMVRELGVPFGVAVNRVGAGDDGVFDYCASERIPLLLSIPNDRRIAAAYSRGELAVTALPELEHRFLELYERLRNLALTKPMGSGRTPASSPDVPQGQGPMPSELVSLGKKRDLPELVVISGKGGTGKTSIAASFAALAQHAAVADCDVDAADLHLVLGPTVRRRWPFSGGKTAVIDPLRCTGCGECVARCRFDAIRAPSVDMGTLGGFPTHPAMVRAEPSSAAPRAIDQIACEGCGVCVDTCPERAIALVEATNGEWFVSDTRLGPMAHARLGIAQENSGKLVSLVRREAKAVAQASQRELLICDGSPGIGCPVISSITGAHMVLVVTEPTLSGLHDLRRVADLCKQLGVKTGVCINKADINPEVAAEIEADTFQRGMSFLGGIRYDDAVTTAQVRQITVVENGDGPAASDIRAIWARVQDAMGAKGATP
jgi:MinD superfamily P-loop ATPase